jgi:hypothetical protein
MSFPAATPRLRDDVAASLERALAAVPEADFALGLGSFFEGVPYRDVDVAVWFEPAVSEARAAEIALACSDGTSRPVDLVVLNRAGAGFRRSAALGRLLFARDIERALAFVERERLEAWDFRYLATQSLHDLLRR